MDSIVEEMSTTIETDDELVHYGIKRRSGRYPWGSGDDPYQHGRDFLTRVEELKAQGWAETPENIKEAFGLTTTQYRTEKAIAKDERRSLNVARAKSLKDDGLGDSEIGRRLGVNESTVRSWLNQESEARMNASKQLASFLKSQVDEKKMVDVGTGVELELGAEFNLNVSKEKLNQALYLLEREGYVVYSGGIPQATNPGQQTTQKVLCVPGTEHKEIYNYDQVHTIKDYITRDGGETFEKKFHYPTSIDSKRVKVLLADEIGPDGEPGIAKDGIIQLRRGVEDLSLGESRYSQVRILVDGDKYLKGMAVYSDNMPDGVDVVFNSNKKTVEAAYKKIKDDPDNPFGSAIKDAEQGGQYWYTDKNGERKLGAINKRADEGDWSEWADTLPSQFLSKQSRHLAKKQLDLAKADKVAEYDELCSLTNPTVKRHLLSKFADECDAAAVHLKAAALPGQKYHVIVPINSLKDTEIYAPNYKDGDKLALVRYPHGGTFEIPILTVNNKNAAARKILGPDAGDVVGITKKIADRLSGADFDGDTVMCIPTHDSRGNVKITNKRPLKDLEGFDPTEKYGPHTYEGREIRLMTKRGTQTQMGIISNLITDMTLAGANDAELAKAVKHSMVVIDAEKHKLDYKRSEVDNDIAYLHKKYQGKATGGAATIISKASGEKSVDKRQGSAYVNVKGKKGYDPNRPEGSLIYKTADDINLYKVKSSTNKKTGVVTLTTLDGRKVKYDPNNPDEVAQYKPIKVTDKKNKTVKYTNKDGTLTYEMEVKTQKSTKMAETDDAYTLVSPAKHPMEMIYADYANSMKSLANQARMEMVNTGNLKYNSSAKSTYQKEVDSLMSKLNTAELNTVRERAAQRMAQAELQSKKAAGQIEKSDEKKVGTRALNKYRTEVGSVTRKKRNIDITDLEWEAIQAGAISDNQLTRILNNTDTAKLRERATPRSNGNTLRTAQVNRIKAMASSNYTLEQIAAKLGVSPTTVSKYLKGVK